MTIRITQTYGGKTDADLTAFEDELGGRLSDDYRSFLLSTNGGEPEQYSRLAGRPAAAPAVSVRWFCGLQTRDEYDLGAVRSTIAGRLPTQLLPIGIDSGGNLTCLDYRESGESGAVFYWDHDQETDDDEQPTWAGADRLADSFGDFLARLEPAPEDAPNAPGPSKGDAGWVDPEFLDEIER